MSEHLKSVQCIACILTAACFLNLTGCTYLFLLAVKVNAIITHLGKIRETMEQ